MPWEKQFSEGEALDRAMQAFWSRGYEATSMQDLVACTGVNRASLYATYGDKRGLFMAALRSYDDRRRQILNELERRLAPREAIQRLFNCFIEGVNPAGGDRGCFLTNTALELSAHDPEIRELVAASQEDIEAFFVRLVERGQADGSFAQHVRPQDAGRAFLSSLLGVLVLVRSRPDRAFLESIAAEVLARLQ